MTYKSLWVCFGCCHQKRISGPLLDRIDIHIEVPRVDYERLNGDGVGKSSETIRTRVQAARDIQNKRFVSNGSSAIFCNAEMKARGEGGRVLLYSADVQLVERYRSLGANALTKPVPVDDLQRAVLEIVTG